MATGKYVVLLRGTGSSGDDGQIRHIPGANCYHTLCGWCDVSDVEEHLIKYEGEPNCASCLDVVRKALEYRKYVK